MTFQKYKYHIFSFGACFILSIFLSAPVFSQDTSSVTGLTDDQKKEIDDKQDKIDAINAKIKAYKQIVDLKQRQGLTLADQVTSLEAQVGKLELEVEKNKEKITTLEEEVHSLSIRISEKESLFTKQKEILAELMRVYYEDYSSEKAVPIFSSSETLTFLNQENWTTQVGEKITEFLISIKELRESLTKERISVEEKKKEASERHSKLTLQESYLESTKVSKSQLLIKTQTEVKKYDGLVNDLQEQRDEIESEINALESGKLSDLNLADMPTFKHGLLEYPLEKHILTQGYGNTKFAKSSGFYKSAFHNGLDFGIAMGTNVLSAGNGKVVAVGNNGKYAYGRYVAIDHGNGIITMYGHLSSVKVSRGNTVKTGDTIAKSGSTGNSTGPHLHFTVFSSKSFDIVPSKIVSSLKDIPIGATVNPSVYLP